MQIYFSSPVDSHFDCIKIEKIHRNNQIIQELTWKLNAIIASYYEKPNTFAQYSDMRHDL